MTPEQVAESNRKQAEYQRKKKDASYIVTPDTGSSIIYNNDILLSLSNYMCFYLFNFVTKLSIFVGQHTQLGTGVSAIFDTDHTTANENINPNETNDWLHTNDNYLRSHNNMWSNELFYIQPLVLSQDQFIS